MDRFIDFMAKQIDDWSKLCFKDASEPIADKYGCTDGAYLNLTKYISQNRNGTDK